MAHLYTASTTYRSRGATESCLASRLETVQKACGFSRFLKRRYVKNVHRFVTVRPEQTGSDAISWAHAHCISLERYVTVTAATPLYIRQQHRRSFALGQTTYCDVSVAYVCMNNPRSAEHCIVYFRRHRSRAGVRAHRLAAFVRIQRRPVAAQLFIQPRETPRVCASAADQRVRKRN
jgi:hypothetical protein